MGDLTVTNSMFLDSQEGILGGEPTGQKIVIDRSTFAGLGQCDETRRLRAFDLSRQPGHR